MVKKLLLALALLSFPSIAQAVCVTPLAGLDATSTSRTFLTVLDGSSNCISTQIIVDGTAGANKTAVKAASTAAAAADPSLVVALSPNSPLPAFASNPTVILGTGGNTVGAVTQSGTWTVQPGNTANTTPWLVSLSQGGNTAVVKAGNTAATTDPAQVTADANVLAAINSPGPVNVTPTDCSGTISVGGTAQNAITAGASLHGFVIANIDTTEVLWFSMTTTAAASGTGSFPLAPATATTFANLASFTTPVGYGMNTNLSVVAATGAHKFTCTKW